MAPPHGFEAPSDSLITARAERKGVDFQVMGREGFELQEFGMPLVLDSGPTGFCALGWRVYIERGIPDPRFRLQLQPATAALSADCRLSAPNSLMLRYGVEYAMWCYVKRLKVLRDGMLVSLCCRG